MEIPVYFSDELSNSLHLFQFPNKSRDKEVNGNLSQKILAKSFKIDVALDDHNHFSLDQAMHLSRGSDEKVDKISLVSRPIELSCNFLIGRLKEDGLYLNSLDQISHFYPSLDHLDKIDDLNKQNSNKIQDAMEQDTTVEDAKIVHMSMRNNENPEMIGKMENQEFLRKLEDEKWTKMEWNQVEREGFLNQIFYPAENELIVKMEKEKYLDLISPALSDVQILEKVKPGLSLSQLAGFSLKDRVTGILMNSNAISFGQLYDVLDKSVQIQELLDILQLIAICIRGIWIIDSAIVYTERVRDARNFLLYLFLENEEVDRSKFNEVANLPLPMSKGLFSEIAYLGKDKKWRLKVEPDEAFMDGHKVLIQAQAKRIKENGLTAIDLLAARNAVKVKREGAAPVIITNTNKPGESQDKILDDCIHEVLSKHQVANLQFILQSLNEMKAKKEKDLKNVTKELVSKALDRLCFSLRGIYILKELGPPKFYEIRSKVVDCFRRKKTVSIGNVRTKIKGIMIVEPTKDELVGILNSFATVDEEENWTIRENPLV